ncbi:MAG: hypothetical protein CMF56_01250 [Leifsonia sp.]|nr:hypothetical protein [Leifsonia sp.]|tara:strand:- start:31213 stop:31497 length:285 start_codon:yes stop_codon:yes gene_type:complete
MSAHHRAQKWTTHAPKLKVKHAATLPRPCIECGKQVSKDDAWQVGHIRAAALGGRPTMSNTGPVHTSCNRRAGGKLGARIVNARRQITKDIRPW